MTTLPAVPIGTKWPFPGDREKEEITRIMSRQDEERELHERRAFLDWKDIPRWSHLRDVDRVYLDPYINDRPLWMPRVDVFEEDSGHMRLEVELPGVPKDDINVIVDRSEVTICALKPHTRKEARDGHLLRERHFGRFFRRLRLPYLYHLPTIRYIAIRVKNPWLIM
ncbi:uncharacterized protein ACA1_323340 [Acanthamoeba castellanii str. Neff]|uniref:SHSP domain-containing protein n=1 Tax=Acanthamoeba castellanii (strain ATCC 30010 / Neff) TaxID=1257118 RepID=L8H1J7_ACACF|nr:uncharacterized protein ACA1_323340 [Acanthamoeba castellanii str. Neff]ELR19100.1 hypothetical protein ACA1_323340 [Acanthamoeba castellanii str. Neff]